MEPERRNAPVWMKLLVGVHVAAITSWALPRSAPGVANQTLEPRGLDWVLYLNDRYGRNSPLQQYVLFFGFWQSWDMFAPNPTNSDVWGDAIVTRKDGKEEVFQYPRVFTQNYYLKYVTERYRKYYERAHLDSHAFMREPFAKRIALLADNQPGNPVVKVILRRHYIEIPRIIPFRLYLSRLWEGIRSGTATKETWLPSPPAMPDWTTSPYYTYEVPGRL
jgi:hypothetical protein